MGSGNGKEWHKTERGRGGEEKGENGKRVQRGGRQDWEMEKMKFRPTNPELLSAPMAYYI